MSKISKEEKKLVEICFDLVLTCTDKKTYNEHFKNKNNEEKAAWVKKQLEQCGFELTGPIGSSWGYLKNIKRER